MNATIRTYTLKVVALIGVMTIAGNSHAAPFTIVDAEGFESPAYDTTFLGTGQLEGQFAETNSGFGMAQWVRSPLAGTGSAVVQTAVVQSGSQAVQVDRAANSDDRWAVPVDGFPSTDQRFICIEWDMFVEEATATPDGSFGPFFGIEAYDEVGPRLRIGSLGVDSATGDVLLTDVASGFVTTGAIANFDEWNSFRMVLDFQEDTYYTFLNDVQLLSTAFEGADVNGTAGNPVDEFTDADIAALAAFGDAASLAATGTAYFDNYFVFETDSLNKIPEPTTMASLLTIAIAGLGRRRRS